MFSQSISGVLDETIRALGLASILYPLERVQTIKQIQATYLDSQIESHKSIVARSLHNGFKCYFRGYMPFVTRLGILNISTKITELENKNNSANQNGLRLLSFGFSTLAYFLTYPLEIVNIRMSAEVERQRFYINTRQCISKVKKSEGIKTLYRGFIWGYSIFTIQFAILQQSQNRYMNYLSEMSQWQKIGATFGAIGISEAILYPLITLKKIYQINGSMGHTDKRYNIRSAFRQSRLIELWRGFQVRLSSILIYSLLYFIFFDDQKLEQN